MEGLFEIVIWIVKQIVKNPIRAFKCLFPPVFLLALFEGLTMTGAIHDKLVMAAVGAVLGLVLGSIVLYVVSSDEK